MENNKIYFHNYADDRWYNVVFVVILVPQSLTLKTTNQARNLVVMDKNLKFKGLNIHWKKSSHYHLKNILRSRGLRSQQDLENLSMCLSSLLSEVRQLQLIQNDPTIRKVTNRKPVRRAKNWPDVIQRTDRKILLLLCKALNAFGSKWIVQTSQTV